MGDLFEGNTNYIRTLALGAIKNRIILTLASIDGTISLWDVHTRTNFGKVSIGTHISSIDFRSDIGILVGLKKGILAIEVQRMLADQITQGDTQPIAYT
jgi:WD40 repeat protein